MASIRTRRALAVVLGLMLLATLVSLRPIDRTPYTLGEPYRTARVVLESALADHPGAVTGPLEVGFGRAELTPRLGAGSDPGTFAELPLAGYAKRRGATALGVHDRLWSKAVALRVGGRTLVLLSADLLIVPPRVAERFFAAAEQRFGLTPAAFHLAATHTHASFGGWGEGLAGWLVAGTYQPAVVDWISDGLLQATAAALSDLRRGRFGHATVTQPESIRNRLVGEIGRSNPRFELLAFEQREGRRGVVGIYSAHPTLIGAGERRLSGGYPGAWQWLMEEAGVDHAMFMAGSVGSQAPRDARDGVDGAFAYAARLAQGTRAALDSIELAERVTLDTASLQLPLPPFQVRVGEDLALAGWLGAWLLPQRETTRIGLVRLDRLWLVATPADYSAELANGLAERLCERGQRVAVTGFNGDYIGYVLPPERYDLDRYESRAMSLYGPWLGSYLQELIALGIERFGPGLRAVD